jgi:hypothetical protein
MMNGGVRRLSSGEESGRGIQLNDQDLRKLEDERLTASSRFL